MILLKIATERDCVGVIPSIRAENTTTASPTPKFPGVIDTKREMLPMLVRNKACIKLRFIPKI